MSDFQIQERPVAAHRNKNDGPGAAVPRKRFVRAIVFVVIALVAIGGIYAIWVKTHSQSVAQAGPGGRGGRRGGTLDNLPVVVRAAEQGDLNIFLNGLGTVTSLANVTVRTRISGQLTEVHFTEGQMVNKGDLLAVIDPRPYEVALEQAQGQALQAQAQLDQAQSELARFETLSKQDSISQQQLDTQRALVNQFKGLVKTDQAAIDSAQLNLVYCHIVAPVSGRVGLRQIDAGNYVTPSDAGGLVSLTQVKPISVLFTLPEDNMPRVMPRLRSGGSISVDAYDRMQAKKVASGTLSSIDNQADTTTGTFRLRAIFSNDDEALFPNQFVNVRMLLDVVRGATVIPTSAVERGQQGVFVYVVDAEGVATARVITLGTTEGERVEVSSGLKVGEQVVTDGADRLRDGAHVSIQQTSGGDAAGARPAGDPTKTGNGERRRRNEGGQGNQDGNAPRAPRTGGGT